MPGVLRMVGAAALAAAVASLLVLLGTIFIGRNRAGLAAAIGAIGSGTGYFAGCWLLSRGGATSRWHWPPTEDQDRFLFLLLPAAVVAESVAALLPRRWAGWLLRLTVAALAARVLLHGSVYLTDAPPPSGTGWSVLRATAVYLGLGSGLALVWAALGWAARRRPGVLPAFLLAAVCAACAVTMMLAGYLTGGPLAVPLAGALLGTTLAAGLGRTPPAVAGGVGVGTVVLFGLLVIGRFFGSLDTGYAAILFATPLLSLLPSLRPFRGLRPWVGAASATALTALALVFVVAAQLKQRERDEGARPASVGDYSPRDYDFLEK